MNLHNCLCSLALLLSSVAHAEYTIILTDCDFTSGSPEQKANEYVEIRRTYLAGVGSNDPQDQITYNGFIFRQTAGGKIGILSEAVIRIPGVPQIPQETVQFADGADFNLILDVKTLTGTFAYKNSTVSQPVQCSASGDGKYW